MTTLKQVSATDLGVTVDSLLEVGSEFEKMCAKRGIVADKAEEYLSDAQGSGISNCCSAGVTQERCNCCLEMCEVIIEKPKRIRIQYKIGTELTCPICSEKFIVQKDRSEKKTCSLSCSRKFYALSKLGRKNPQWKDDVGYYALHMWVKRNKPFISICESCHKKESYDLANISQEYKRDINDFEWLCRSCHMKKDGRMKELHRGDPNATSKFRGVSRQINRWIAQISIEGKKKNIGSFINEEDAARAYDATAVLFLGDDAEVNFPNVCESCQKELDRNGDCQLCNGKAS